MSARLAEDNGGERLGDLLDRAAEPGRVALVTAETGETLSYESLTAAAASLAGRLATLGVGRGSRVALVLPDGPDFLQLLLAVDALGATAAPLNPAYKRDEYAFYLDDLAARAAARPRRASSGRPRGRRSRRPGGRRVARATGRSGCSAGEASDRATSARSSRPSRTTSRCSCTRAARRAGPKQVPLLQRNLTASARTIAAFYGLGPDDVSYCAMPLFHVHGLVASTFGALAGGGTVVVPRRFAPRAFWPQARDARRDVVLGRADAPPDDPRARSTAAARPRRSASRARAARRSPRR